MSESYGSGEYRTSPQEEVPQEMSIQFCRGCLSMEAITPVDYSMSQAFTRATGVQWHHECLPRVLCVLCKALVTKYQTFRETAQRVNDVLMQLMSTNDFNLTNISEIKRKQLGTKPIMESRHFPPNHCDLHHDADCLPNDEICVKIEENELEQGSTDIIPKTHIEKSFEELLNSPKREASLEQYDFPNEEIDLDVSSIEDEDIKMADFVTTMKDDTEDGIDSKSVTSMSAVSDNSTRKIEFQCDNCKSKFKNRVNLTRHVSKYICLKYRSSFERSRKDLESRPMETPVCSSGKPHACDVCDKRFSHFKDLTRHMRSHTGEKPHVCNVCDRKFSRSDHLLKHIKTHTKKRKARKSRSVVKTKCVCDDCGIIFSVSAQLKRHMITHTGEKPQGCNNNLKKSTDQYYCLIKKNIDKGESANDHKDVKVADLVDIPTTTDDTQDCIDNKSVLSMSIVSNDTYPILEPHSFCHLDRPHACDICGHRFTLLKDMKRHMRTHTGEKPHVCNFCDRKFSRTDHLQNHMQTHTKGNKVCKNFKPRTVVKRPCVCDVCGFKFSVNADLKRHMRIHTGEKPHGCSICSHKFSRSDHLLLHMKTHTEKKPKKCKTSKISKNIKTCAVVRKPAICPLCGVKSSNLKTHMRTHTGEKPFACSLCGKTFSMKGSLIVHMRTHTGEKPHVCNICSTKFARLQHLNDHIRIHTGEKPHACDVCGFKFGRIQHLKKHMRTHTGEKPYACHLCASKFSRRYNLQTHIRTHTGEKPYACNDCDYRCDRKKSLRIHIESNSCKFVSLLPLGRFS